MKREEPTEAQLEAAARMLADHMRQQLERHGMDSSPEAVRLACKRRLRARLALCERPNSPPRPVTPRNVDEPGPLR